MQGLPTPGLEWTKLYLTGGDAKEALEGLKKTSSMLRREVSKKVGLRYAPELRFFYDDGLDRSNRIDELLEEVKRDAKKSPG